MKTKTIAKKAVAANHTHMNEAELLTTREFADALRVTVACVRRWAQERKIESVKVGRLVGIPANERRRIVDSGWRPATRGMRVLITPDAK
jgi:excisionase family DNA binding protein